MTQEQATALQSDLNDQLTESGNTNLTYGVYAVWNQQAQKEYNVILFPIQHKDKFAAANTSGQFSVVRVSIITQSQGAQTSEIFINNFNAEVLKDPEANNLLNK